MTMFALPKGLLIWHRQRHKHQAIGPDFFARLVLQPQRLYLVGKICSHFYAFLAQLPFITDSVLRPGDPQNATVTQFVMSKSGKAIENARAAFRRREVLQTRPEIPGPKPQTSDPPPRAEVQSATALAAPLHSILLHSSAEVSSARMGKKREAGTVDRPVGENDWMEI